MRVLEGYRLSQSSDHHVQTCSSGEDVAGLAEISIMLGEVDTCLVQHIQRQTKRKRNQGRLTKRHSIFKPLR